VDTCAWLCVGRTSGATVMRCSQCGAMGPLGELVHSPNCKYAALFPHGDASVDRKPYEPPTATPHALSWDGELNRLELLALEEELRRSSFHGPAFKQWALMRIDRCKKLLDTEMREKLAASGLPSDPDWMQGPPTPRNTGTPQVCSCVNPPRLAIGETSCPSCGGSR
jgi:hypothetical protein